MAEAVVEIVPLSFGTTHSHLFSFEPVCENILVTLDVDNIVEVYMWSDALCFSDYENRRGMWILCVSHIIATSSEGHTLPIGWQHRGRCIGLYKYCQESGAWIKDRMTPQIMTGRDNTFGVGSQPAFMMPDTSNVFVIFHANNVPLSPPQLQVFWWRPNYDRMPIPNSLVLQISDRPLSTDYFFRTLSVWIGGRGGPWVQDGESSNAIVPVSTNENHF